MAKTRINTQLSNLATLNMHRREMFNLTQNRIQYTGLSKYIDIAYVNKVLFRNGVVASFVDEILGHLILPFQNIGTLDVYGRPTSIQCYGMNGYRSKILKPNEYVLLYDTTGRYPLIYDIEQYAQRIALADRTMDINISQQKTPRLFKTSNENKMTVQNIINNVDDCENTVLAFDGNYLNNFESVLAPAPYVTDKLMEYKKQIYSEFLNHIGICNLNIQKKERLITDEVSYSQGGTIAGRYATAEPRIKWKEELDEKFNIKVDFSFYDGLPVNLKSDERGSEYDLSDMSTGE